MKNEEKYKKAIEELKNNSSLTIKDMSIKYNFDRSCFSKYMKKIGFDYKIPKRSNEKEELYKSLSRLYVEGESINSISKTHGISAKSFSKYLIEKGLKERQLPVSVEEDESFFDVIDTEEKAYWLGFIYADGCVRKTGSSYKIQIELSVVDENHLLKLKKAINSSADLKYRRNNASLNISKKHMYETLCFYGCVPNKTTHGSINIEIRQDLKRHFIRGFFDGDGYLEHKSLKKYRASMVLASKEMIDWLMEELSDFSPRIEDCNSFSRIHIERKEDFYNFIEYLYEGSNIYLDRKYYTYMYRKHARLDSTLQKV